MNNTTLDSFGIKHTRLTIGLLATVRNASNLTHSGKPHSFEIEEDLHMNKVFQYGNNPDGYTQQEIDQEHIEYDEEIVRDALDGCVLGVWSRQECSFGDGNGASTALFEEVGIESAHHGFIITMPDGSQYQVSVAQVRGPHWAQVEAMKSTQATGGQHA